MKNESPQRADEVSRQRGYGERQDDAMPADRARIQPGDETTAAPEVGEEGLLASEQDERSPNVPEYAHSDHGKMPSEAQPVIAAPNSELLVDAYSANEPGTKTKD